MLGLSILRSAVGNIIRLCERIADILVCGNSLAAGSGSAPTSDCNMACSGNAAEVCGGGNRLNLYWSGKAGPSTNLGVGNWAFSGCYT